jgi:hypothetical protein
MNARQGGRKLRVLLLTHAELYARDSVVGKSESEQLPWRTEYHVMRGLRALGHESSSSASTRRSRRCTQRSIASTRTSCSTC